LETFNVFFELIARVLAFYYELIPSFGFAIIALTLTVMVILTPLTLKGTRSMMMMQQLQPEMKKLQSKYKDDRQKLNEEMLKFYKEHNINPVGGCLPLLLQTPLFNVLYRVLHGLTNPHDYAQDMGRAFGLASASRNAIFDHFGTFDPSYLDQGSHLYKDLAATREMNAFGLDLSTSASQELSKGLLHALPYLALIAIIGVTAWYQQRQIQGRNPNMASQVNPQQQMLMKIFPYFLPVISFTLPAGIVLYFLVSNLYRIGQQGFITRTMYRDSSGNPIIHTTATDTTAKAKGATATKPKGLLASLKDTMSESGPKVGPNANGNGKAKAGTKASAKPPAKSNGKGGKAPTKATAKTPAKGAKAATSDRTAQKGGGSKPASPAKGAAPADTGAEAAPPPARPASSPSRQPPAPNPNRSRAKKKRR
jgi:YidC/Oxa1 family membrane protein insertase